MEITIYDLCFAAKKLPKNEQGGPTQPRQRGDVSLNQENQPSGGTCCK